MGYTEIADSLSPLIVLRYVQHVEPSKVLGRVSAKINGKLLSLRLATATEIKTAKANQAIYNSENRTNVYIKPSAILPKNSEVKVIVLPGVPSKEGPNKSRETQEFSFRTYAPFAVSLQSKAIQTMWTSQPAQLVFNNQLNKEICKPSMFNVVPAVKNFTVTLDDSSASFTGDFKFGVVYQIQVSSELTDIFGQKLSGTHGVRYTIMPRPPQIFHPSDEFGQMIPSAKPAYHVFTYNEPRVKVSILRAEASDWKKFDKAYHVYSDDRKAVAKYLSSLKVLFTRDFQTSGHMEKWNDVSLDLSAYVKDGNSHLVVVAEAPDTKDDHSQKFIQWIEYSPIRINVFNDTKSLYALATNIRTGKAISGAEVVLLPSGMKSFTDKDGLTKFSLDNGKQDIIQINQGSKSTILPHADSWRYEPENGNFIAYQNTDRNLYKPGETVRVQGLLRWSDWLKNGELVTPSDKVEITYSIKGSDDTELAKGFCNIDKSGAFSFQFAIPQTVELGPANIALTVKKRGAQSSSYDAGVSSFQIAEFRRPEFEVAVSSDKSSMVLGDTASVTSTGLYRTGSAMPHSKVHWRVKSRSSSFTASDFYLFEFNDRVTYRYGLSSRNDAEKSLDGISGLDGADRVSLRCSSLAFIQPVDISVSATVQDLNRQDWSQNTAIKVHPASVYVGLRQVDAVLKSNTPKAFEFVVTDTDGKVQPDYSVHLSASKNESEYSNLELKEKIVQEFDATSAKEAKSSTFNFQEPGAYYITADVADHQGRHNRSRISVTVEKDDQASSQGNHDAEKTEEHKLELKLNKEHFKPKETAEITVLAPFATGHGVLVAKNNLIVSAIPFDVDNQQALIKLPIEDTFYPQLKTEVHVYGPDNATASGDIDIDVPTEPVDLSVTADTNSKAYEPGQAVNLKVSLKDAQGSALDGGHVALAVVDESILALTGYSWSNPLYSFYSIKNYLGEDILSPTLLNPHDFKPQYLEYRSHGKLSPLPPASALPPPPLPGGPAEDKMSPAPSPAPPPPPKPELEVGPGLTGLGGPLYFQKFPVAGDEGESKTVKLRSDLNPLAYYNPTILTGPDGTAHVTFTLPGNLTKYKVMAVAVKGAGQFGTGNSIFTASLPLMVRPSLPRFLNFRDQCDLPFVVQNTTDKPVSAELVVRASNLSESGPNDSLGSNESNATSGLSAKLKEFTKPNSDPNKDSTIAPNLYLAGRTFEIPANDRVEIRLPVAANVSGAAEVQVATFAGGSSDASELSIPLQPPVTSEAFATYGQLDDGAVAQKIDVPKNVINEVGGLEITTSSTAMQQLFDAGEYLRNYPYGCSEQLSSQLLGLGALGDLILQFKAAVSQDVNANDIVALQKKNVIELCKRQQADGGFGLWIRDEKYKYPFVSIQCARSLFESAKRKIAVPQNILDHCLTYLKTIESHVPKDYAQSEKISLAAYALNVRFKNNDADPAKAKRVVSDAVNFYNVKTSKSAKTAAKNAANLSMQELLQHAMSLESMAWLLPVLSADRKNNANEIDAMQNILSASTDETSSTANLSDNPYGDRSYLMYFSPNRLNAIVLESLIATNPTADVIPKMVKGLLLKRRNGRWMTTQENACSLLALSKYFSVYEKADPNFVAQFWLGEAISFEEKFVGRNLDSNEMKIPMEYLQTHMQHELLTLVKKGVGRLYYRVGMKCASMDLKMPAVSRGFTVERKYLPVDSASDVTRDASGILHVKSGATLKVVIKITNPGMRYHVAMVDPFPAGFEALDPDTVGTRAVAEESNQDIAPDSPDIESFTWHRSWYDHQNFRDNQAEAFSTLLYNGQVEYTYFAHATTPGTFIVPPCKVEEMYDPETFGRSATETVVIK